jgi:hypothetical protein
MIGTGFLLSTLSKPVADLCLGDARSTVVVAQVIAQSNYSSLVVPLLFEIVAALELLVFVVARDTAVVVVCDGYRVCLRC